MGRFESAYNAQDAQRNYQYRAFGVPGLGLKRGLGEDLVVAPYASVSGRAVTPAATASNLVHLISEGLLGRYGLYEAIDYTAGSAIGKGDRGGGAAHLHGASPGYVASRSGQQPAATNN